MLFSANFAHFERNVCVSVNRSFGLISRYWERGGGKSNIVCVCVCMRGVYVCVSVYVCV